MRPLRKNTAEKEGEMDSYKFLLSPRSSLSDYHPETVLGPTGTEPWHTGASSWRSTEIGLGFDPRLVSKDPHYIYPSPLPSTDTSTHTELVNTHKRRKRQMTQEHMVAVNRLHGVCLRCRQLRMKCYGGDPCGACKKLLLPSGEYRSLCLRGPLTRIVPILFLGVSSGTVVMEIGNVAIQELLTDTARKFLVRVLRTDVDGALADLAATPLAGERAIVHVEKVGELIRELEDLVNTRSERPKGERALLLSCVVMIVTRVYMECKVREVQSASETVSGPSKAPTINTRSWAPALETLFGLVSSGVKDRQYIKSICLMASVESGPDVHASPRLDSSKSTRSENMIIPGGEWPAEHGDQKIKRSLCERLKMLFFRREPVHLPSGEHKTPASPSVDETASVNQSGEVTSRDPQIFLDSRLTNDLPDLPPSLDFDSRHDLGDPSDDALSASERQRGDYLENLKCSYCGHQALTNSAAKCVETLIKKYARTDFPS